VGSIQSVFKSASMKRKMGSFCGEQTFTGSEVKGAFWSGADGNRSPRRGTQRPFARTNANDGFGRHPTFARLRHQPLNEQS
jgi:hypothetical protein